MGQHKFNETAMKARRGDIQPKPKVARPLSKREESFLSQWEQVIARRPDALTQAKRDARRERRGVTRAQMAAMREILSKAASQLRDRAKAARKQKAA